MSEKIYACLLRLYPSHFREAYGEEAMQLFRDRARDESGLMARLRLWLDLVIDLAISIPREYGHVQPRLAGALSPRREDGMLLLCVLESESPRPGALLFGSMLSLLALVAIAMLLSFVGRNARGETPAFGHPLDHSGFLRHRIPPREPLSHSAKTAQATGGAMKLDAAERQRVIDGAMANLKEHYVDRAVAQKVAEALDARAKAGDDDAVTDGAALAGLLTKQMREVSHDMHLEMVFSERPLPIPSMEMSPEDMARYRAAMEQDNCTFEAVKILPHNIGYLKFNSFPEVSVCRATAVAALARLNNVNAIIFDLRDNRGGFPQMTALIAAYLFDHPEFWFSPRENTTQQSWTQSPVPGNKLADKPAYILTSTTTLSGAEQFCYDLKMLKRATLVGETTGGATHAGVFHRIDDHFGIAIDEVKPINPFSKPDWEGTGVEPDVKVKAADALKTAVKVAENKLQKK